MNKPNKNIILLKFMINVFVDIGKIAILFSNS